MIIGTGMIVLMVVTLLLLIGILVGFCLYPKCYGCWAWRKENAKPASEQGEEWKTLYAPKPVPIDRPPSVVELGPMEEGRRSTTRRSTA